MKRKSKKNNDKKQARTPVVSGELVNNEVLESSEGTPTNDFMETPVSEKQKGVTLKDLAEIDPELLTGKSGENVPVPELPSLPESKNSKISEPVKKEDEIPTEINLDKNEEALEKGKLRRNAGILFVAFGIILVAVIAALSFALDTGMNESFISPLTINGREISSGEFSFMYHYELLSEGVDLFAADTEKMLSSPYLDDDLLIYLAAEYTLDVCVERNTQLVSLTLKPVDIGNGTVVMGFLNLITLCCSIII